MDKLLLLGLAILISGCAQQVGQYPFGSFSDLHKSGTRLPIKKIDLTITSNEDMGLVNGEFSTSLVKKKLNQPLGLCHIYPSYESRLSSYSADNIDTLVVYGQKFNIQYLLRDTSNQIIPQVTEVYEFNEGASIFLCVMGIYMHDVSIGHLRWCLFFDITNRDNVRHVESPIVNNYATDASFIGDFNKGKKNDFCFFDGKEVSVFNIARNVLRRNDTLFLKVDLLVQNSHVYCIDLQKSTWFYPLKSKSCQAKKGFIFHKVKKYY
jgi:hypothetical protein